MVDHINNNPADNRLSNLRWVTSYRNMARRKKGNNSTGYPNVFKRAKAFAFKVIHLHEVYYRYGFPTPESAFFESLALRLELDWIS